MAADLKKSRSARCGALTREINTTMKFADAGVMDEVQLRLQKIKDKFTAFEEAHEAYHVTLDDDAAITESDAYFDKVQETYINAIKRAQPPKLEDSRTADLSPSQVSNGGATSSTSDDKKDVSLSDVLNIMNLPNLEIEAYEGDPLLYHTFITWFEENVEQRVSDNRTRINLLMQNTKKTARDAIRPCLMKGAAGYAEARKILEQRFGNAHVISDKVIKNLKEGSPVKSAEELVNLSDDLRNGMSILQNLGKLREVDTQSSIVDIVNRLEPFRKNRWRREAMEQKRKTDSYPTFSDLVEFVQREAADASDPVYGQDSRSSSQQPKMSQESKSKKPTLSCSTVADNKTLSRTTKPCVLCSESHRLFYCPIFKEMKPVERRKLVNEHKLCHNCLLGNHVASNCRKPSVCSVPGCGAKHTKFIHVEPSTFGRNPNTGRVPEVTSSQVKIANDIDDSNDYVIVPVVPVVANDRCKILALLDTASNTSFCTRALANKLGLQGMKVDYVLNTMSKTQESKSSCMVNFKLKSVDGKDSLHLSNVYIVDQIPVRLPNIDVSNYPHMCDLQFEHYATDVHILLGQDNPEALVPLEIRKGRRGDPFAVRTLFGWSVNGPVTSSQPVSKQVISHFVTTSLEEEVNKLWKLEDDGSVDHKSGWSQIDKNVVQMWDSETRRVTGGHYEVPLPWKPNAYLANNVKLAESRLKSLMSSLKKSGMFDKYDAEIKSLLQKGYAEPVPSSCNDSEKIWYLPHHAVTNENKPGKIRVVFDCSAKCEGESLNDKCYQGPDMNNKLLHVLLRFRQHDCAFMGDIEAMYHQVFVPEDDQNALRFLWYDGDEVQHYRMTRHIFGGVWASSAATYAVRRTVADHGGLDPLVDTTVLQSFYVDDCLRSVPSKEEAIHIINGTSSLLKEGGFKLTKFVSNNRDVLDNIPSTDVALGDRQLSYNSPSKALGVRWSIPTDELFFDVGAEDRSKITKRSMLKAVSSMFDPLGLISPVLIVGKMLFQSATRLKIDWDEEVPLRLQRQWHEWTESLKSLVNIGIPRCVKPSLFDDAAIELHHFCDASERGYGACTYVRCLSKGGEIHVALLFSKAKVAPIKTLSIPRLELQAALLSARIDVMLRNELTLHLIQSYFWSDSEIALCYIKNTSRRFHVFVANRIGEISRLTKPEQWFHIPGQQNPADIASRGTPANKLDQDVWFHGPSFLRTHRSEWKQHSFEMNLPEDDPEVKREPDQGNIGNHYVCATNIDVHPLDSLLNHYSGWTKLKRAVAWLLKFKEVLRNKGNPRGLTVQDLKQSEIVILRHVQSQHYSDELSRLSVGQPVNRSSVLKDLCPMLKDGLLCVGGRISHANVSEIQKHPYIVPHKSDLSLKIVREIHNDAHLGTEWTLSLVRHKYWITSGRSVVKKVRHACVKCRRINALPCTQQMADLPVERLSPDEPPFTFVGVDYFGPLLVKVRRSQEKRYGCIYTCLTTRAIHLEMINSLDTDSFLNGFRRFVSRRGKPKKIWSDNGTNFTGGLAELKKGLREMQRAKIDKHCTDLGIEWVFNPPHASHMGGIWERLIRVVRNVLTGLLTTANQRLTDEILLTLLCEAESVINGRPITKVSSDVNDLQPLTPNHLLLLREGPSPPPGIFLHDDKYRRRWRYVQHLADQFWKRWIREYIPELQKRHKWTDRHRNINLNDLVLICDENTPRSLWPLGIVVDVTQGRDGLVRSVKIRTKSTILVRPITKVVLLEGE